MLIASNTYEDGMHHESNLPVCIANCCPLRRTSVHAVALAEDRPEFSKTGVSFARVYALEAF